MSVEEKKISLVAVFLAVPLTGVTGPICEKLSRKAGLLNFTSFQPSRGTLCRSDPDLAEGHGMGYSGHLWGTADRGNAVNHRRIFPLIQNVPLLPYLQNFLSQSLVLSMGFGG